MILAFPAFARDNSVTENTSDTIAYELTQDESILFNMINDMRRQNMLPSIPLSKDLCIVAQTHIADLIKMKPQEKGCSLHSWSGAGKWTACCNTKEVFGIQCMKSKPREITGYAGDGYELIYWGEDNAIPAEAAALWRDVEASSDMILSRAKWSNYQWRALGVGIKGGYAILWLGDSVSSDKPGKPAGNQPVAKQPVSKVPVAAKPVVTEKKTTKPETVVKQNTSAVNEEIKVTSKTETGTKYYVIVSSVKSAEAAQTELKKVKSKGYPNAFIVEGNVYRIALSSYNTVAEAAKKKNELKETFPGIWVFTK
jgi:cell division septation protein DedD